MSLDNNDLTAIRQIVSEELLPLRSEMIALDGEVKTLGNDVKEIYNILVYNGLKVIID